MDIVLGCWVVLEKRSISYLGLLNVVKMTNSKREKQDSSCNSSCFCKEQIQSLSFTKPNIRLDWLVHLCIWWDKLPKVLAILLEITLLQLHWNWTKKHFVVNDVVGLHMVLLCGGDHSLASKAVSLTWLPVKDPHTSYVYHLLPQCRWLGLLSDL